MLTEPNWEYADGHRAHLRMWWTPGDDRAVAVVVQRLDHDDPIPLALQASALDRSIRTRLGRAMGTRADEITVEVLVQDPSNGGAFGRLMRVGMTAPAGAQATRGHLASAFIPASRLDVDRLVGGPVLDPHPLDLGASMPPTLGL